LTVSCHLVTEHGEVADTAADPEAQLNALIPSADDTRFCCWRFIDQFGDTTFNPLQMGPFLAEVELIRAVTSERERLKLLDEVHRLATACRDGVHVYLKFVGD